MSLFLGVAAGAAIAAPSPSSSSLPMVLVVAVALIDVDGRVGNGLQQGVGGVSGKQRAAAGCALVPGAGVEPA